MRCESRAGTSRSREDTFTPGLVGFVKENSAPDCSRELLTRMAQALEADPRYAVALHHEGGVGLGRVGLPAFGSQHEVVWNREQTRCLVLEGELYDVARLRRALAGGGDRSE